jgi:hypothetical protein
MCRWKNTAVIIAITCSLQSPRIILTPCACETLYILTLLWRKSAAGERERKILFLWIIIQQKAIWISPVFYCRHYYQALNATLLCMCAACREREREREREKERHPCTFSKTTSDAERPSLSLLAGQAKCMAESAPAAKREVNKRRMCGYLDGLYTATNSTFN